MPTNLPLQLTSFIGRERELGELRQLLTAGRLLTLTGAGGVGKSRLAIELAARVLEDYPDGVWWVELALVSDPTAVPGALAAAFEMHEQPGEPLIESIGRYLHDRRALLVLDNCEHLVLACAHATQDLLRACPALRVLATSREALNTAGERTWLTPSMALQAAVGPSEAAELFIVRGREIDPGFAVASGGAFPQIETICRQLDGIPLAIELAAPLTGVLSLDQVSARLSRRFELLTGGRTTALPRHRTLRALVDWSYEQLSDPERVLFRRLAVFVGGWRLEAAEVICADEQLPSADVLPILVRLVTRSLVMVERADGDVRYSMLETLREYAGEKLAESGEEPALRQRQLAWLVEQVEQAARSGLWSADLEREHENIVLALRWAREHPTELADGVRLCFAALWSWNATGRLAEALQLTHRLVDSARAAQPKYALSAETWTALLATAGFVAVLAGDVPQGKVLLDECLSLSNGAPEDYGRLRALVARAFLEVMYGNPDGAEEFLEASAALVTTSQDLLAVYLYHFDRFEQARLRGDLVAAEEHLRRNLTLAQAKGDLCSIGIASIWLGRLALDRGDLTRARLHLQQALHTLGQVREFYNTIFGVEGFAALLVAEGHAEKGLFLAGATAEMRLATGQVAPPAYAADLDARLEPARATLGAVAAHAARLAGRQMSRAEAIAYALSSDATAREGPVGDASSLTAREREVAALIGRGFSNRQIAEALVITNGTAGLHVQHIFDKLGVHNRERLATWALAQGMSNSPKPFSPRVDIPQARGRLGNCPT